ncbi:hypothetical protein BJY01DRAFT_41156 [Aspergillus pseudoustus]|uniref:Zn(2)-C6 fungal-type domain-containing protein n=1 Tax=Aspergillus pseudoustus TaxID=1810923 RepID=A0ABR4JCC3_9EURO
MARPDQRHACDRCHGQKLRCIHTDTGPCLRCTKAKATCIWSQPVRSNRPKKQDRVVSGSPFASRQPTNQNISPTISVLGVSDSQGSTPVDINLDLLQAQFTPDPAWPLPSGRYPSPTSHKLDHHNVAQTEGGIEATPDWMWPTVTDGPIQAAAPVDWQQAFNREWTMMVSQNPIDVTETPPELPASSTVEAPQTACPLATIRELSQLNIDLYSHQASVPIPPASLEEPITWKDKDFAIDRTFALSQRLIKLVNGQYPRYLETARGQTVESTLASTAPEPQIDQGSCLLILSCYTRLIETYDRIFANMQGCLDRSSVTAPEDYVSMPNVQIGSFSLPHSSSLQIVLILQLARELLNRMGEVIRAVQPDKKAGHIDTAAPELTTGSQLLSSTLGTVSAEEDRLMKRITKLRTTLIALNIL